MSVVADPRAESNPHRDGVAPDDRFDTTWPVKKPELIRLLAAFVVVAGTGILVGFTLTDWAAPNALTRFDDRVANAFADNRTTFLDSLSHWGSFPADTFVKIGISVLICAFFLWKWRRWDEAVYVALPLVLEACCFIAITKVVQRPRPDVERLIESTINSSFPSGHVAAATVYAAVVVVVFRHSRATWVRGIAVGVFLIVLIGVMWARMYMGMHYVTDVVAGVVLGATSLVVSDRILRRRHGRRGTTPRPVGRPPGADESSATSA